MRPLRLELDGFLSYQEPTSIDFEELSAAVIVGPNGAGKTGLVEAILWALYGKGRGRSPDDFISTTETSCRVAFEFSLGGDRYRVERQRTAGKSGKSVLSLHVATRPIEDPLAIQEEVGWSPLGGDMISETQAKIEQLIGLDADGWLATSFIGQGTADAFTRRTPAERKGILSDVLGLDAYTDLAERARAIERELSGVHEATRQRIADLERGLEREQVAREQLDTSKAHRVELEARIEGLEDELTKARDELAGHLEKAAHVESARRRLEELIRSRKQAAARAERDLAEADKEADHAEGELIRVEETLEGVKAFAKELDQREVRATALRADVEAIISEEAQDRLKAYREAESALEDARAAAARIPEYQQAVTQLANRLGKANQRVKAARDEQAATGKSSDEETKLEAELEGAAELVSQASSLREAVHSGERTIAAERQRLVEIASAQAKAEEVLSGIERIRDERDQLTARTSAWLKDLRVHDTLARAFGRDGIPALVIENAVPQIESEANRLLERLTDGRFTVQIESLRAKKGGGLKETLDVIVADETSERPLEELSGGERQCVDLALRVALARLLAHRAGRRIETLILDEAFTALDATHKQRAIEVLRALTEEFPSLLFITHLTELADAFGTRIEVSRNGGGSKVEVSS